jgi:tetratricopeptide (TPR) repeat protein
MRTAALFRLGPWVSETVGFTVREIAPLEYAQSQPGIILHYLRLVFWPVGQCLDYGWPVAHGIDGVVLPGIALTLLLAGTVWALIRAPGLGFCSACVFLILAPTSSIVPLKDLAFEHRMYLPVAAVIVLVVLGADFIWKTASNRLFRREDMRQCIGWAALVVPVGWLVLLTILRNDVYRTKLGMWEDVVAKRPNHPRAQNNLGNELVSQGRVEDGIPHLVEAIRLDPNYSLAHYNLGTALTLLGKFSDAVVEFQEALRIDSTFSQAHYNLGNALSRLNKPEEAIRHFAEAARLEPTFALAHFNQANTLAHTGRVEEAIVHYREALRLEPENGQFHGNLGGVLMDQGELPEAIDHFRASLLQHPQIAPLHNNLGLALLLSEQWGQAAECFRRASDLQPRSSVYHRNLAFALYKQGQIGPAKKEYQMSLQLDPHWPRDCIDMAWNFAASPQPRQRNGRLAIYMAEQTMQAQGKNESEVLDALAAAYAETGQFSQAEETARRSLALARKLGKKDLAKEIEVRLALYQQRRPFRVNRPL